LVHAIPHENKPCLKRIINECLAAQIKVKGSQFASLEWQAFLKTHNLEASMSRRGNCYDNAVQKVFSPTKK
jgi:hypothetical protein